MIKFDLSPQFHAIADRSGLASGEVHHVERNRDGGSISTPVARFFVSAPPLVAEGPHRHKRLDCFVRKHELAPRSDWLARRLAETLIEQGAIHQPIWLAWHEATEIGGEALGEVFDDC
jgi:hypothetical protein